MPVAASANSYSPGYAFCDRPGYFQEVARLVAATKKGDRVALMSMTFDSREPLIAKLVEELCAAARRGVSVVLNIDAYIFLVEDYYHPKKQTSFKLGPLWFHKQLRPQDLKPPFQTYFTSLEALAQAGGTYRITNIPNRTRSNPKGGRSHIKFAVVNDVAFIGGHNLKHPQELDIMTRLEHHELAVYLYDLACRIATDGNTRRALQGHDLHQHFELTPPTTNARITADLFVDAGVSKQSRILNEALAMIDASEKWLYLTCQYFPGGRIGQHLARAVKRGVHVKVIYSPPGKHGLEKPAHQLYNTLHRLQLPSNLFEFQLPASVSKIHAKLLATEKGAMLGSHNYVTPGVRLGTGEIALQIHDPQFSREAVLAIARLLPPLYGYAE